MDKLFNTFVKQFNERCLVSNKKIIVGGHDLYSAYFNWLLKRVANKEPEIMIDNLACIYGLKFYREPHLELIDCRDYIAYVPCGRSEYTDMFDRHGIEMVSFEKTMNCKRFGFYEWLESNYCVDLLTTIRAEDIKDGCPESTASGPSRQMGLFDVLDTMDTKGKRVLDIGCGKGGALTILSQYDFSGVDGLEISPYLCEKAQANMEKLNLDCWVFKKSATGFKRYADYDVLYLYDPFRGETFREFIKVVERAVRKKQEPTTLVYANPYHHLDVIRNGVFKLERMVDTDFFHRNVMIYTTKG